MTPVNKVCISIHNNERNAMHSISLQYTDLSQAAMVKIFQLADLLGITPTYAAQVYLAAQAKKAQDQAQTGGKAA